MRVIQLKITSLIRFTQGYEVSVADFYLAYEKTLRKLSKNYQKLSLIHI